MLTTTASGHVALKGPIGIPSTSLLVYARVCAGVLFLGNTTGRYAGISELAFLVEVRSSSVVFPDLSG